MEGKVESDTVTDSASQLSQLSIDDSFANHSAMPKDSGTLAKCLPVELLFSIIQFLAPITPAACERDKVVKVLAVVVALDNLFGKINFAGEIDFQQALSFLPFLAEIKFLAAHPSKLKSALVHKLFPVGNLSLSLLLSFGGDGMIKCALDYILKMTDKGAQQSALRHWCNTYPDSHERLGNKTYFQTISCMFDPDLVRKFSRHLAPGLHYQLGCALMHFVPDFQQTLVNSMQGKDIWRIIAAYILHPVHCADSDSMRIIFNRNKDYFSQLPLSTSERNVIGIMLKVKFGDSKALSKINVGDLNKLLDGNGTDALRLVTHFWARQDIDNNFWRGMGAHESSKGVLSKLAFDPESFIANELTFGVLFKDSFSSFLAELHNQPQTPRTSHIRQLLRSEVLAITSVPAFSAEDQDATVGLKRLLKYFLAENDMEVMNHFLNMIFCAQLNCPGKVEFKCVMRIIECMPQVLDQERLALFVDKHKDAIRRFKKWTPIIKNALDSDATAFIPRMLASSVGVFTIFKSIKMNRISSVYMGKLMGLFGISKDQLRQVLCSLAQPGCYRDELSETLKFLQDKDQRRLAKRDRLPKSHTLWLYLQQEYPSEFAAHMGHNIVRFYQESRLQPTRKLYREASLSDEDSGAASLSEEDSD